VWPAVERVFGPGKLFDVQGVPLDVARQLDYVGIDYFFEPEAGELFGIAARVQRCDYSGRPWNAFSLSERQYRRLREVGTSSFGRILPAVIVQAFVKEAPDRLVSVGVAKLADVGATVPTGQHKGPSGLFRTWSFARLAAANCLVAWLPEPRLVAPFGRTDAA
jgi:hypothetical protein